MKLKSVPLIVVFALPSMLWAQKQAPQTPGPESGSQTRAERRQHMMEMHKQEMAAMKADIDKMKASLAEMKANMLTIREPNELARWRNNADMWETVVTHMEQMQKRMESMATGMMEPGRMGGPGPGGPPQAPPGEQKP